MMSRNKTYPLRKRASYWFDNRMAEGFWPKVRLLFIVTIIFIIVIGGATELDGNLVEFFGGCFEFVDCLVKFVEFPFASLV